MPDSDCFFVIRSKKSGKGSKCCITAICGLAPVLPHHDRQRCCAVTTYHKRVWKVSHTEAIPAEPIKRFGKRTMASYNIESDYVGVVYSETEKVMELYVGYKVNGEKTIPNIIGLAVKLEVKKIIE